MIRHFNFCVVVVAFIFLTNWTIISSSSSSSSSNNDEHNLIFKIQHTGPDKMVMNVGRAGEEDETGTTQAPEEEVEANSTCPNGGCCYQFTWPGPSNFSCERNSPHPCKSPGVITNPQNGQRPNLTYLENIYCQNRECKIYCARNKMSCIKYSIYKNEAGGRILWNETKFCGTVTSANNQKSIRKGCYLEEFEGGYTKEVCVCDKDKCNSASTFHYSSYALFFAVIIFLFAS